jgi:Fe-S-cluster containining protein
LHGCSIVQRGDSLLVLVPKSCEFLDKKKLQCTVYDDRPAICRLYAKRERDAFKSDVCGLSWKPVRGRGAQMILSKMRGG